LNDNKFHIRQKILQPHIGCANSKYKQLGYTSTTIKGEVSSKMTYSFYWPDRISIFLENFL